MQDYQREFFDLMMRSGVLKLGEFTLKSGRISPYFFNMGQISSGADLKKLAELYLQALDASGIEYDLIFGPAYKGIPLATALALANADHGHDIPFAYNRKEAKDHGEGGVLVGAAVQGRVVIIDDVITAGTAIRQSVEQIQAQGAQPVAALIALDRQEKGASELSAVQQVEQDFSLQVVAIATVTDFIDYLEEKMPDSPTIGAILDYQRSYGLG